MMTNSPHCAIFMTLPQYTCLRYRCLSWFPKSACVTSTMCHESDRKNLANALSLPRSHCWIFFFLFELYLCSKPPKGQEVNAIYCRSWYCGKFCKNAWTDQLVECFCFARNVFANTVNQPRLKKQNPKDLGFKQRPTQPIHCYPSSCTIVSSQHWRKTSKEQDLSLTKFLKKGHECNMSLV